MQVEKDKQCRIEEGGMGGYGIGSSGGWKRGEDCGVTEIEGRGREGAVECKGWQTDCGSSTMDSLYWSVTLPLHF